MGSQGTWPCCGFDCKMDISSCFVAKVWLLVVCEDESSLAKKISWKILLLMVQKSGDHQLRLVVYPTICKGFLHPRWLAGFQPSKVSWQILTQSTVFLTLSVEASQLLNFPQRGTWYIDPSFWNMLWVHRSWWISHNYGWSLSQRVTLQGINISPWYGIFEDYFPFLQVGYVSFLEGKLRKG